MSEIHNGVASSDIGSIIHSINQSYLLTQPKQLTATSRTTQEKTVCSLHS